MRRKHHFRKFFLLTGALLFVTGILKAQQVQNYVHIDSLRVGDTLTYIITAHENQAYDNILFPDSTDFGKNFIIRSKKHYKPSAGSDSLVYHLQFFGLRDTVIAPVPVAFISGNDTVVRHVLPVPVYFKSEVKDTAKAGFKPLKPIYDFSGSIWPYIILAILLLIIAYLVYRYYRRKKMQPPKEPEPEPEPEIFIDPLYELQESLRRLREDPDLQNRAFKPFYSRLGDTLRQYYERVYKVPALEMTTGGLIRRLRFDSLDREMMEHTRSVLTQADMVKFAKLTPTLDRAYEDLATANRFLERARQIDGPQVNREREAFEQRKAEKRRRQLAEQEQESRSDEEAVHPEEPLR